MAKFRMKPMVVEATTFDELIKYGLKHTDNIYNGMPWSFKYMNIPIIHETDDCYIIGGTYKFTRDQILVVKEKDVSVVDIDAFELISEPVKE